MDGRWRPEDGNWLHGRWPDRHDDVCGDLCVAHGAHLHHGLHERRCGLQPLFCLHFFVHLLNAHAGDEQQPAAALFWLGSGGSGVVFADWLLVQQAHGHFCQHEGLLGQSCGRLWLYFGHCPDCGLHRQPQLHRDFCQSARAGQYRVSLVHHGPRGHAGDGDWHLFVHWSHGQVSAVSSACVVARLHGRPHTHLGPDSRRHHGDCRHFHGGAHVAHL